MTRMPAWRASWTSVRADASGRAEHDDRPPGRTFAARWSMRHAVTPLTTTVSAATGSTPAGQRHDVGRVEDDAVGPAAGLRQRGDGLPHGAGAAGARAARRRRRGRSRGRTGTAAGRSTCRGASAARRTRRRSPRRGRRPGPASGSGSVRVRTCSVSGSPMPGRTISVAFMVIGTPRHLRSLELLTKVWTCYALLSSARLPSPHSRLAPRPLPLADARGDQGRRPAPARRGRAGGRLGQRHRPRARGLRAGAVPLLRKPRRAADRARHRRLRGPRRGAARGRARPARRARLAPARPRPRLPRLGDRPSAPLRAPVRPAAAGPRRPLRAHRRRVRRGDGGAARRPRRDRRGGRGARARAAARNRAPRVEPRARDGREPGGRAARGDGLWARLHGHIALEIGGNFASMGLDPEALFEADRRVAAPRPWRDGAPARRTGRMRA